MGLPLPDHMLEVSRQLDPRCIRLASRICSKEQTRISWTAAAARPRSNRPAVLPETRRVDPLKRRDLFSAGQINLSATTQSSGIEILSSPIPNCTIRSSRGGGATAGIIWRSSCSIPLGTGHGTICGIFFSLAWRIWAKTQVL